LRIFDHAERLAATAYLVMDRDVEHCGIAAIES
jgi:hypothetical protein